MFSIYNINTAKAQTVFNVVIYSSDIFMLLFQQILNVT
jgi:hypothetical protein